MLGSLIARLNSGDQTARSELIKQAYNRVERMVRRQLKQFSAVRRWEETGDVLQAVLAGLALT